MNNVLMVSSHIKQAERRSHHAREAVGRGSYPYMVRRCQEAVELLLKASLILVDVKPLKCHDAGPVLKRKVVRFPQWFQREVSTLARTPRKLGEEREPSMHGDEENGALPMKYTVERMPRKH